MPPPNKYLDLNIEDYYRRGSMEVVAHCFIDTTRFQNPSITIEEAAQSFMIRWNIDEELYSRSTVIQMYYRVNKDLSDMQKHRNNLKSFPIKTNGKKG